MKKLVYLLNCLFLLTAALAACSSDYDDPPEQPDSHQNEVSVDSVDITQDEGASKDYTVISTVPVSEEVKAFFDEALPNNKGTPAFTFPSGNETEFSEINSQDELESRYKGESILPEIDFAKFTLIIGKAYMLGMTYHVKAIEIHKYEYNQSLCVFTDDPEGLFWMAYNMYFWGMFPKIEQEISSISIIPQK
ncbi:MAG: hypothetical protein IKH91_11900 [Prevotella sp.]|nr:hypothetical protein [Prevotella sp.]